MITIMRWSFALQGQLDYTQNYIASHISVMGATLQEEMQKETNNIVLDNL